MVPLAMNGSFGYDVHSNVNIRKSFQFANLPGILSNITSRANGTQKTFFIVGIGVF
jgi:hypothetical protein